MQLTTVFFILLFSAGPGWACPEIDQIAHRYALLDAVKTELESTKIAAESTVCDELEATRMVVGATWLLLSSERRFLLELEQQEQTVSFAYLRMRRQQNERFAKRARTILREYMRGRPLTPVYRTAVTILIERRRQTLDVLRTLENTVESINPTSRLLAKIGDQSRRLNGLLFRLEGLQHRFRCTLEY